MLTMTCETMSRAFFLSSAGTTYQGASAVLVFSEAVLVGSHVAVPVCPLVDVAGVEFPVLLGIVDPSEKALALLVLEMWRKNFMMRVPLDQMTSRDR